MLVPCLHCEGHRNLLIGRHLRRWTAAAAEGGIAAAAGMFDDGGGENFCSECCDQMARVAVSVEGGNQVEPCMCVSVCGGGGRRGEGCV